jgi:transposase-like protein
MYLYRSLDAEGNTIDFYLSKSKDKQAAKYFLKKTLDFSYVSKSRVITVDKKLPIRSDARVERREPYA